MMFPALLSTSILSICIHTGIAKLCNLESLAFHDNIAIYIDMLFGEKS